MTTPDDAFTLAIGELAARTGRTVHAIRWYEAQGLVPGEPNEGLTAQLASVPARQADYDDSAWEVCTNVRKSRSKGASRKKK